jgi:predicted DNA-binding transcriptional regulator AlpA
MNKTEKEFLTVADLKEMLSISEITAWRWVQQGNLPTPFYISRRKYWKRQDVIDHIDKSMNTKCLD